MKILNFGSLNTDIVLRVEHIVRAGETVAAKSASRFCGGKGLNQSIALARAGACVYHAGCTGDDGKPLTDMLTSAGVDTTFIRQLSGMGGTAIISVDDCGQNSIIVDGGANRSLDAEYIDSVLSNFDSRDILLVQNETNMVVDILQSASERGITTAFNPSPVGENILSADLSFLDYLIFNETEGAALTGETDNDAVLSALRKKCPRAALLLTLGEQGSLCSDADGSICYQDAFSVHAVDTTGAGDTFTGYFLAQKAKGASTQAAMETAAAAAAISVGRAGAAVSVPSMNEVIDFLKLHGE